MRSKHALGRSVPPGRYVGRVRTALYREVLTGAEIDNLGNERVLVDHNVVWLQITVHNSEVVMQILQAREYLLHNHSDLCVLGQLHLPLAAFLLDPLRQAQVHAFKHNIKPTVLQLDALRLHNEGAVAADGRLVGVRDGHASTLLPSAITVLKFLQDLNLALLERLLPVLVFVLKLFDCNGLTRPIALCFIYVTETAFSDYLEKLVFTIEHIDLLPLFADILGKLRTGGLLRHAHHILSSLRVVGTFGLVSRETITPPVINLLILGDSILGLLLLGTLECIHR